MKLLSALFLASVLALLPCSGTAQQSKKMDKLVKLYFKGKEQKAIEKLWKLARENDEIAYWNGLMDMTKYRYDHAWDDMYSMLFSGETNIVLPDRQAYFSQYINACRQADLAMINSRSSQLLRNHLVDYYPDTAVADSAKKEFDLAEEDFIEQDFNSALNHYYKAVEIQPDYYQAVMYLGDSYYAMEVMDSALIYFRRASEMHPDLLEPRKYISDALANLNETEASRQAALETFYIYPDVAMFWKYADLVETQGKTFDRHWIKRGSPINSTIVNAYTTSDPVWASYQSAKEELLPFCDSNDVVVMRNKYSNADYLEVYSWEKMLVKHPDVPEFAFAHKVMMEGYLDCFVFISQFHYDLYPQFKHFAANNRDRIKYYLENYLTE